MFKLFSSISTLTMLFAAFSSSSTYQLNSYSVGSGSTNSTTSPSYSVQGAAGDLSGSQSSSTSYATKSGGIEAEQANVPPAPTLSNGSGTYFNKLNFIISTGGNPTDATYSIAVSTTSNFTVTNYVQADGTLAATAVYQTYTSWGGASGTDAIGLVSSTTYWFKVDASQGKFTNSAYGPSANLATAGGPSLSFSLSPSTMNMGSLLANTVVTSPSSLSFTFSTNAANGGSIYMAGQFAGLRSTSSSNYTIQTTPPSANLSAVSEGFGLQGLTASSPLAIQTPFDGTANVVGAVLTTFQPVFSATSAVGSGTATANLLAKSSVSTPSATDYQDTLTFIAAAVF
ncbi:MAG TPA: hypothetical protein VLH84_02520 [Patescibacteria group bacterium]|nr:hypothetical protein [Patescibacteria group bacterium]